MNLSFPEGHIPCILSLTNDQRETYFVAHFGDVYRGIQLIDRTTNDRTKALRFGTHAEAEAAVKSIGPMNKWAVVPLEPCKV